MTYFFSPSFKKICTEPRGRGRGNDMLIQQSILENKKKLSALMADDQYKWIENVVDSKTLMLALDQLHEYYGGGSVSEEQWGLAGYYAYKHLDLLDTELANG